MKFVYNIQILFYNRTYLQTSYSERCFHSLIFGLNFKLVIAKYWITYYVTKSYCKQTGTLIKLHQESSDKMNLSKIIGLNPNLFK